MRNFICACIVALLCGGIFAGCKGNDDGSARGLPKGFSSMPDTARVAWLMERIPPDSLARFLYRAAMGEIPNAKIDTLAIATLYAYENYKDSALVAFSEEFEDYPRRLPLAKRMKAMVIAGNADEMQVGYGLGLEYVGQIREQNMNLEQVDSELSELRKVCAGDTAMYDRFMLGFKTALIADHGKNLNEKIYKKYTQE